MTDPTVIARKIKAVAAAVEGVQDARLGVNSLTVTPAVEVWLQEGQMAQRRAAGQGSLAEAHAFQVAFYVPLTPNMEDDELQIGALIKAFVDRIHDPAFDYTFGGLVEITRCTRYGYDLISRNGRPYQAGIVAVEAELI